MLSLIFGLVCAAIGLIGLALLKTYNHVQSVELKRRARAGDPVAELLYKAVAYGASLNVLLWFVIGLSLAGSVVLFSSILPTWLAVIFVALLVWVGFAWIPSGNLSRVGILLARRLAPPIAWLLNRLQPIITRIMLFIRKHRPVTFHTGLYEKTDLVELLEEQKSQTDNRIPHGEIDLLTHALSFGDKLVSDAYIPKRVVDFVKADDAIGPILMEELHKTGHSRFPVLDDKTELNGDRKHENIVGVLYLHDLIHKKQSGTVRDVMKSKLTYVHEDFTLYQTLQAFIKTKHHLFLVVNSFEEFAGIITIEDVLEQMVGKLIVDEFDNYEDLRAVAAATAKKEHVEHKAADAEPVEAAHKITPEEVTQES